MTKRCMIDLPFKIRNSFVFISIIGAFVYVSHIWWFASFYSHSPVTQTSNFSSLGMNRSRPTLEGLPLYVLADERRSVAIGFAMTSRGAQDVTSANMQSKLQLFHTLLPSFCSTASADFLYIFYIAHDHDDPLLSNDSFRDSFRKAFEHVVMRSCAPHGIEARLTLVTCNHTGRPAWAQNDAMMEAYRDGVHFFYRINDDTKMVTANWTHAFVATLAAFDPPYVGVVGPTHRGGHVGILTYDFVHRTHIEIFGYYYPRMFTDWSADNWITNVYVPGRSTKLKDVLLDHMMSLGTRYKVHAVTDADKKARLAKDRIFVTRYVEYKNRMRGDAVSDVTSSKVIAMSLYGNDIKHSWGAIRNAQIAPILFPGWKLRLYVANPNCSSVDRTLLVSPRILHTLVRLGAQLAYLCAPRLPPPRVWRLYALHDTRAHYALMRDCHARLSARDAAAVADWLNATDSAPVHCVRDHARHGTGPPLGAGRWGVRLHALQRTLNASHLFMPSPSPIDIVFENRHDGINELHVPTAASFRLNASLEASRNWSSRIRNGKQKRSISLSAMNLDSVDDINSLWPLLSAVSYCHDSVSCHDWPNSHPFPVQGDSTVHFVGQLYDENELPLIVSSLIESNRTAPLCERTM